ARTFATGQRPRFGASAFPSAYPGRADPFSIIGLVADVPGADISKSGFQSDVVARKGLQRDRRRSSRCRHMAGFSLSDVRSVQAFTEPSENRGQQRACLLMLTSLSH